jgi:GDP-4-dehydro-6-deoxy-D-mannose reductase
MANRALITGIAGFAGSHLAELLLLEEGVEISGSVFPGEPTRNIEPILSHLRLETCDIRDAEAVDALVKRARPDEIYHLAAIAFIPESIDNPRATFETNLFGTMNVLEAARKFAAEARVLFVGSADEYGLIREEDLPVDERNPLEPLNPYSVSKASAGMLAHQYAASGGMDIVRVRPFNHTGPRQSPSFVCSDFARQVVEIERGARAPELSVGSLRPRRDFSDVRDVVRAYRDILRLGESGEVYNICSGRAVAIGEIVEMLVSTSGREIAVVERSDRLRGTEVEEVRGDFGKIEKAVGWRPSIPMEKTLEDLIEYWRGIG